MKIGFHFKIAFATVFCMMPALAMAQYSEEPKNGDLIRLDAGQFWQVTAVNDVSLASKIRLADGLGSPSISPNGERVILHRKPEFPGDSGKLFQWSLDASELQLVREDADVSNYVTWTANDRFFMREQKAPFFEHGQKLNFAVEGKRSHFRSRRAINENPVLVYQADDAIIMKRNNVVEVISDVTLDRYFSPIVSSDENFIVFVGLASGINLFDIAQNAVVYQDALGAYPSFSPDGRYLVYTQAWDDGHVMTRADVMLVDLHHKKVMRVANPDGEIRMRATVSQDASFMAYETVAGEVFRVQLIR